MIHSSNQPETHILIGPELANDLPKYAVINADIRRGRDWVSLFRLSPWYGVPGRHPQFWQACFVAGGGPRTIILDPDLFCRAKLSGKHVGLYVDRDAQIHCLPESVFLRELYRRYQDAVITAKLTWNGDWTNDRFAPAIPELNIGEAPFVLA